MEGSAPQLPGPPHPPHLALQCVSGGRREDPGITVAMETAGFPSAALGGETVLAEAYLLRPHCVLRPIHLSTLILGSHPEESALSTGPSGGGGEQVGSTRVSGACWRSCPGHRLWQMSASTQGGSSTPSCSGGHLLLWPCLGSLRALVAGLWGTAPAPLRQALLASPPLWGPGNSPLCSAPRACRRYLPPGLPEAPSFGGPGNFLG